MLILRNRFDSSGKTAVDRQSPKTIDDILDLFATAGLQVRGLRLGTAHNLIKSGGRDFSDDLTGSSPRTHHPPKTGALRQLP
jgi:hypothetical protein